MVPQLAPGDATSIHQTIVHFLLSIQHGVLIVEQQFSQPISPNISQETLAEMIGTTRSRVSHFMNKFRKLGFISYNGHIEVNTSLLSVVLREKPVIKDQ